MEIIFATLGTVGEGGIQSSLEFCMCGSGFGPNCRTFCRLSPIHRHFLAQSSLLRCLPPLWLHLSQICLSVGWRKYGIFAKKRGLCSARAFSASRGLCVHLSETSFLPVKTKTLPVRWAKWWWALNETYCDLSSLAGPLFPAQWRSDWATLVPICSAAAEPQKGARSFQASGLHQAWVAHTLPLALVSVSTQAIFK